ncbi:MAG: hypothetical protein HKN20_18445 [Gemmatimonadetes bacterium]|nr:hypothetical protein [Gemmatimonadota bacterium]
MKLRWQSILLVLLLIITLVPTSSFGTGDGDIPELNLNRFTHSDVTPAAESTDAGIFQSYWLILRVILQTLGTLL